MSTQIDAASSTKLAAMIRSLTPNRPPDATMVDDTLLQRAERSLGTSAVEWARQVARDTANLIMIENFDDPDVPVADQITTAGETALLLLLLELVDDPSAARYPMDSQADIIRYRVAHGTTFEPVVRAQRFAQHKWCELLLESAAETGIAPAQTHRIVTTLDKFFDHAIDWHLSRYIVELERYAHSAAAERAKLLDALIAGDGVDARAAYERLNINLAEPHIAVTLQSRGGDVVVSRLLSQLSAPRLGAKVLCHQPADGTAWMWLTGARATDALERLAAVLRNHPVQAGAGSLQCGHVGFRRSHLEASDAMRFACQRDGALVHHRDVALAALLSKDIERARWFVDAQLGSLKAIDPAIAELRETLSHYYEANMRLLTASEQLHIHRNTLVYRLNRITQLLGHPVGEAVAEVRCALLLVAHFGDEVLGAS